MKLFFLILVVSLKKVKYEKNTYLKYLAHKNYQNFYESIKYLIQQLRFLLSFLVGQHQALYELQYDNSIIEEE